MNSIILKPQSFRAHSAARVPVCSGRLSSRVRPHIRFILFYFSSVQFSSAPLSSAQLSSAAANFLCAPHTTDNAQHSHTRHTNGAQSQPLSSLSRPPPARDWLETGRRKLRPQSVSSNASQLRRLHRSCLATSPPVDARPTFRGSNGAS